LLLLLSKNGGGGGDDGTTVWYVPTVVMGLYNEHRSVASFDENNTHCVIVGMFKPDVVVGGRWYRW
jgi:hypothetical protein